MAIERRAERGEAPVRAPIVFVLATIGFCFAIEIAWFTYAEYPKHPDPEGGVGMGVLFIVGPICAGILGAGTTFLFGGKDAPRQVKVAAWLIGLLTLAALRLSLLGL